jgi:hypothetical protein
MSSLSSYQRKSRQESTKNSLLIENDNHFFIKDVLILIEVLYQRFVTNIDLI